ncbi:MAG: hypothetical protein E7615_08250 [Ruminococcaceae bacterium]|nr:hypothetical protein [Oscillospiraceae bacterium]
MNENKKVAWLYVALTVVTSAVAVVFQYILLKDYAEVKTGLYPRGSMTPVAFYIFLAIAAILFCTSAFMLRKDLIPGELKRGTWYNGVFCAGGAVAVVFYGIVFFKTCGLFDGLTAFKSINKLEFAGACIAFLVAAYFLAVLFFGKSSSNVVVFLSFFAVLWTLIYLLDLCFDKTVLVNSPAKILRQLSLVFLLVYQLLECRALIGKAKPRLYFVSSCLTVVFMSASVFPELLIWLQGDRMLTLEATCLIYLSALTVYVFTRSIAFAVSSDGDAVVLKSKAAEHKNKPRDDLFSSDDDSE